MKLMPFTTALPRLDFEEVFNVFSRQLSELFTGVPRMGALTKIYTKEKTSGLLWHTL